jgi:hypothetical protein
MKEVTLTFTAEELLELAKQLTIARCIVNEDYKTQDLAESLRLKICATGFKEFNENADYDTGGCWDLPFVVSAKNDDDCYDALESHNQFMITDYIARTLADRDFCGKHKIVEAEEMFIDPALLEELNGRVNEYKWELLLNGIENFKLVKKKPRKGK